MAASKKCSVKSQVTEKENTIISYKKWIFLGKDLRKGKTRLKKEKNRGKKKPSPALFSPEERFQIKHSYLLKPN